MACMCRVSPGRFEGEPALTFLAHFHIGEADATTGDRDWFRRPFHFDGNEDAIEAARLAGYCQPCITEALESEAFGLEAWTSSNGFASCRTFDTEEEYDAALGDALAEEEDDEA